MRAGSRPASRAPAITVSRKKVKSGSATQPCMMAPSATRPAARTPTGRWEAMYIGISARTGLKSRCAPSTRTTDPGYVTVSPARSWRITSTASRRPTPGLSRAIPSSRKPLTPAPSPSTARCPDSSSSVAMAIAVRAGWRE